MKLFDVECKSKNEIEQMSSSIPSPANQIGQIDTVKGFGEGFL